MTAKHTENLEHENLMELPPELAALEAALASVKIETNDLPQERAKAVGLLEICRYSSPEHPELIDLIVESGEDRVFRSLKKYLKKERFRSISIGIVIGLISGVILNVLGMISLLLIMQIWPG